MSEENTSKGKTIGDLVEEGMRAHEEDCQDLGLTNPDDSNEVGLEEVAPSVIPEPTLEEYVQKAEEILSAYKEQVHEVVYETLMDNLEKEIPINGDETEVVATILCVQYDSFAGQDVAMSALLNAVAELVDRSYRIKAINRVLQNKQYTNINVDAAHEIIDDKEVNVPPYTYTVGLSDMAGVELFISTFSGAQISNHISGMIAQYLMLTEGVVEQLKAEGELVLNNVVKTQDQRDFPLKLKLVDREKAIESHMHLLKDEKLETVNKEPVIIQIYVPDPKGDWPDTDKYDTRFGQELLAV